MFGLFRSFIATSFSKFYSLSLSFVVMFYTLNYLGLESRAEIGLALSWSSTLFTALYLSLGQIAYRFTKENKYRQSDIVFSLLFYTCIISLSLFLIVPVCYEYFIPENKIDFNLLSIACLSIPFLMLEQYFISLNLVKNKIKKINQIVIATKTIGFVLVFTSGFLFKISELSIVVSLMLANVVSGLWFFMDYLLNENSRLTVSFECFAELFQTALSFHIFNAIGYIIYTSYILLASPWYLDKFEFGILEVTLKFVSVFGIIGMAFQTVIMGFFGKFELKEAWSKFEDILKIYISVFFVVVLLSYVMIEPILFFLIKKNAYEIASMLKELLPYMTLMATSLFVPSLFVVFGWFKASALYNIILALVTILFFSILVPSSGLNGVVTTLKIVYSCMGGLFFIVCYTAFLKVKNISEEIK